MYIKIILILCTTTVLLYSYPYGPPPGVTGGFGEDTCQMCHEFGAGDGYLSISGVPEQYVPGELYTIIVELSQMGQQRWGFQLAVRFDSSGMQAGNIEITDSDNTQITEDSGIQYISHTDVGTMAGTPDGPVFWTFDWRAPDEADGSIIFNAAGNAANNDDSPFGDYIYTAESGSNPPPPEGDSVRKPQRSLRTRVMKSDIATRRRINPPL